MNSIVFTGGGSAGHVTPNIALIKSLLDEGWVVNYIGSYQGMERDIIKPLGIGYFGIATGKLRRYWSWQNCLDPFKILKGVVQAMIHLRRLKPQVVFSKGGFVAFPCVLAAWILRIPVIVHESDLTPGLANKLSFPFARKICLTFEGAERHFAKNDKLLVTGTPLRPELFRGCREKARELCHFKTTKPCLMVIGGGQGAECINRVIREALETLTNTFCVVHLCGQGKLDSSFNHVPDYFQIEYAHEELPDLYALSDVIVSRSGANSVYEILALVKPHLFVPLSKRASRGDQIQNANYFLEKGVSRVIDEEKLTSQSLCLEVDALLAHRDKLTEKIKLLNIQNATEIIVNLIKDTKG